MKGKNAIEINSQFQKALDLIEGTDHHVFITGKAGTGKSTLLEYFRKTTGKEVVVLAPTGVAALNISGQTIHSFFNFKPDVTPEKIKKVNGPDAALYREIDAAIIDEISMVRADLFDCVEKFLRLNGPHRKELFGGVQMILIGDLYQLPPVVAANEKEIFSHRYQTPYFFSAHVFQDGQFELEFVELDKIYRQTEPEFIGLLNRIRNRTCTDDDLEKLNGKHNPGYEPADDKFCITLTSTNDFAAERNLQKLDSLRGPEMEFGGTLVGTFDRASLPAEETLKTKTGAQVMLLNNDKYGRWVNGTLGIVHGTGVDEDDNRTIEVQLETGAIMAVTTHTWEMFEYLYDRSTKQISTRKTGSFTQYPLKLAWAVTIHKSQGKTFDNVVIDVGRGAFAHGQIYVALSRCTSFDGIVLTKPITKNQIRMDWRVANFMSSLKYRKAEEVTDTSEKRRIIGDAIRRGVDLEVTYLKPDDTQSTRCIRPITIENMEYKGKTFEGLRAYCRLRGEQRTFRIDRILEIAYSAGD